MIKAPYLLASKPIILMPMRRLDWTGSSSETGIKRLWRLTGRLHDGAIRDRRWFDDRDEAEAFLRCSNLLSPHLNYEFVTQNFITSTDPGNQSWSVPIDCSQSNYAEVIAGGGSGAGGGGVGNVNIPGGGGAGGGYSKFSRIPLNPGGTATFRLEAGVSGGAVNNNGASGKDAWFNGATLAGSSVGAVGGGPGLFNSTGGLGSTTNATGDIKYAGGNGGDSGAVNLSGSGGGAAGPHGAGGNGSTNGSGGSADNGTTPGGGGAGVSGTQFDATHGCGTGGGAGGGGTGYAGGLYGGGGGGNVYINGSGGDGRQGLIVVTFAPIFFGNDAESVEVLPYKKPMVGY